jgi:hypothetical protein
MIPDASGSACPPGIFEHKWQTDRRFFGGLFLFTVVFQPNFVSSG